MFIKRNLIKIFILIINFLLILINIYNYFKKYDKYFLIN